jgi:hypothetical protein
MAELELSRAPGERRLYLLDGIGSIRFDGLISRAATAASNGERWHLVRRGIWGRRSAALDEAGSTVGRFEPRTIRRGGVITWHSRELTLRPASAWRERYALADGETELAVLDADHVAQLVCKRSETPRLATAQDRPTPRVSQSPTGGRRRVGWQ